MKQLFGYFLLVGIISICWGGSYHFGSAGDTTGAIVCFGIGSIFALMFVYAIGSEIRTKLNREFVEKNYEVVLTDLDYVEEIGNDGNLYYIHTKWVDPDGGTEYFFKSDYMYFNPERFLKDKKIPVKISIENYKNYVVDLSMLPKKA